MNTRTAFNIAFSPSELKILQRLSTPGKIQEFLLGLTYSTDVRYRSPATVLRDNRAHCFDGALFAAAALRFHGDPALILDMLPNDRDDDHLLALYKRRERWGAVAKSNFSGLGFREPVYLTIRELVMSYFEQYFNTRREKTLRQYVIPLQLTRFDGLNWMGDDSHLEKIASALDRRRKVRLVTAAMARGLSLVDKRSFQAGLLGSRSAGLFTP